MKRIFPAFLTLAAACATAEFASDAPSNVAGGPVLPDTQTIDGVLVMRHGANAFARAPVWTLDSGPQVVIDGGEEFDLTTVYSVMPLSDGRWVAVDPIGGAEMMLFDSTGRPERLLARNGPGPGELVRATDPIIIAGDTILVADGSKSAVYRYTSSAGLVSTTRMAGGVDPSCYRPAGVVAGRRIVAVNGCWGGPLPTGTPRLPTVVVTFDVDFGNLDTVATVAGMELALFEGKLPENPPPMVRDMRFGRRALVTSWDSSVVIGTGEDGYVLERRRTDGGIIARLEVPVARRPVTEAVNRRAIEDEFARYTRPGTEGALVAERVRLIVEGSPVADSLPPYQDLLDGSGGILWVLDAQVAGDSTWSATAFRSDGAVVGRLTSPRSGRPVLFHRDRVVVREVDEDGVVRFGVYGVGPSH